MPVSIKHWTHLNSEGQAVHTNNWYFLQELKQNKKKFQAYLKPYVFAFHEGNKPKQNYFLRKIYKLYCSPGNI